MVVPEVSQGENLMPSSRHSEPSAPFSAPATVTCVGGKPRGSWDTHGGTTPGLRVVREL